MSGPFFIHERSRRPRLPPLIQTFFVKIRLLIPPGHRQIVVHALAPENLVQVDDAVVEGGGAGAQIQLPHADELFVEHFTDLVLVRLEVGVPAAQRAVVVTAQALYVQGIETMIRRGAFHFPQGGNHAAGEDIFLDPGIARMLLERADEMKQEQSARL